jgi:uncharacterized membrane protein
MSLEDIPSYFAIYTGINETTAQLLFSLIIIFAILVPYLILAHKNPSPMISLLLLFLGEAITLGLGWSPFWLMIMFMVLTSAGIAVLGARTVTGGG